MNLMIKDLQDGFQIEEQFQISSLSKSTATSGKLYYRLVLKDASGAINGVKWTITDEDVRVCNTGAFVMVKGIVQMYRNVLQIDVESIKEVSEDEIDIDRFAKSSPIPMGTLLKKLDDFVSSIKDVELHSIVSDIITNNYDAIKICPAAVSVHHDHTCGLLCHTLSMAEIGDFMCQHYGNVDRDLLISGILLHDIGKTIELEGKVGYHYSLQGKLLGHISIMATLIDETAKKLGYDDEKVLLLKHMILSHHGELEFGSPVLPQTREAILLNLIDNLDSKMEIVNKALEDVKPGEMSQKVFALDSRILYKENKE